MNLKNKLSASKQKLKGKAQQATGDFQMATGQDVKGGISKAKGVLNEKMADAKLSLEKGKDRTAGRIDEYEEDDDLI